MAKRPYIDREKERDAAAWVAVICILGGIFAAGLGYLIGDYSRAAAYFSFAFGLVLQIVAVFAAYNAIDDEHK